MKFVLKKGHAGQEVARLQSKIPTLRIDGSYGPKTEAAVKNYQISAGLVADGIAGPLTLQSMNISVLPGIDLSRHNGQVDFAAVAAHGIKYAWIKVSEGTDHTNPGYREKYKGCRDNGIAVGAYHFGRPDTYGDSPQDAADEAENFLTRVYNVGIEPGDLLPVLDLEAGMKTDDQHNVDWALKWLDVVESAENVRPIVYTAKWYYNSYMKNADKKSVDQLSSYPLWVASYNDGIEPSRTVPNWKSWDIWQWTGSGSVSGVKGKCDQNWVAGGRLKDLMIP
jgi:lysozyme